MGRTLKALTVKHDPVIGRCQFAGGAKRPIYNDGQRKYVIDVDGYPVYGVWRIPEEESDRPLIVQSLEDGQQKKSRR
jgi:hypothetical protein